MLKDNDKYLVK